MFPATWDRDIWYQVWRTFSQWICGERWKGLIENNDYFYYNGEKNLEKKYFWEQKGYI